jgi:hypothetical protein
MGLFVGANFLIARRELGDFQLFKALLLRAGLCT